MAEIPEDVLDSLSTFTKSLEKLENVIEEVTSIPYSENSKLSPVEKIRADLSSLFALNSLYWSYLAGLGKNPKEDEEISGELKRNKEYVARLQALEERDNRPKINQRGAKAFVRNALFDPKT